MDHGFESHVDLPATDNLGHVGRVIGLQEGNLEALILEVALGLGQVQGGMVGGGVPSHGQQQSDKTTAAVPVGQEGDLVSGHFGRDHGRQLQMGLSGRCQQ